MKQTQRPDPRSDAPAEAESSPEVNADQSQDGEGRLARAFHDLAQELSTKARCGAPLTAVQAEASDRLADLWAENGLDARGLDLTKAQAAMRYMIETSFLKRKMVHPPRRTSLA